MTDRICEIEDCGKRVAAVKMCAMHYSRFKKTGSPHQTVSGRMNRSPGEVCSVEGCDNPRRHREWCSTHYGQWRRKGEVWPVKYQWARSPECQFCGKPKTSNGRFCSSTCLVLSKNWKGNRPDTATCTRCGDSIDLNDRERPGGKTPRLRRADVLQCRPCRAARLRRHKMSTSVLLHRDGNRCGICEQPIDMELRHPDLMRASVDHRLPFARGGTHEPDNLQLAHLRCNVRKQAQLNYQPR